ncbi:hypothetical protein O3M35_012096 [Rhynocoris fuscipes]|uniref:Uncharacterized protein n=1 Tax=Rhynocoris fuscipes TaxID=488301 RepID=A0AAW1CZ42_9HEMI
MENFLRRHERVTNCCFIFSLQAGVVIFAILGIVWITTAIVVNMYYPGSPYLIFAFFIMILMLLGNIISLLAASWKHVNLTLIAFVYNVIMLIIWSSLSIASYVNNLEVRRFLCVDGRCPDVLWLFDGGWRNLGYECPPGAEDPETFLATRPKFSISKVFGSALLGPDYIHQPGINTPCYEHIPFSPDYTPLNLSTPAPCTVGLWLPDVVPCNGTLCSERDFELSVRSFQLLAESPPTYSNKSLQINHGDSKIYSTKISSINKPQIENKVIQNSNDKSEENPFEGTTDTEKNLISSKGFQMKETKGDQQVYAPKIERISNESVMNDSDDDNTDTDDFMLYEDYEYGNMNLSAAFNNTLQEYLKELTKQVNSTEFQYYRGCQVNKYRLIFRSLLFFIIMTAIFAFARVIEFSYYHELVIPIEYIDAV